MSSSSSIFGGVNVINADFQKDCERSDRQPPHICTRLAAKAPALFGVLDGRRMAIYIPSLLVPPHRMIILVEIKESRVQDEQRREAEAQLCGYANYKSLNVPCSAKGAALHPTGK